MNLKFQKFHAILLPLGQPLFTFVDIAILHDFNDKQPIQILISKQPRSIQTLIISGDSQDTQTISSSSQAKLYLRNVQQLSKKYDDKKYQEIMQKYKSTDIANQQDLWSYTQNYLRNDKSFVRLVRNKIDLNDSKLNSTIKNQFNTFNMNDQSYHPVIDKNKDYLGELMKDFKIQNESLTSLNLTYKSQQTQELSQSTFIIQDKKPMILFQNEIKKYLQKKDKESNKQKQSIKEIIGR
eukprot:403340846